MRLYVYVPIVGTTTFNEIPRGGGVVGMQVSADRVSVAVEGDETGGYTERVRAAARRWGEAEEGTGEGLLRVPREEMMVVARWDGKRVQMLDAVGMAALAEWLDAPQVPQAAQR